MKITAVKTQAIKIPFFKGEKWSGGTRYSAPSLIVQIETDEGLIGIGESVGPTIPVIETVVNKEFAPFLIGRDPLELEAILAQLEEYCVNWKQIGYYGMAGIEMALLDLRGKIFNTPVYNLLGGKCKSEVEFNGYIFIDTPDNNVKEAVKFVENGYRELKLKVGRDIALDTDRVRAVREAVGPDIKIRIDANQNWSVPTAIKAIRSMEKYGLHMVEQPTRYHDIEGMAAVARAVDVPIIADEGCATFEDALRLIDQRACACFLVYPSEAGGILKARQIVDLANQAGIWCVTGSWAETGIGTMGNVHMIASSRNFPFANDTHLNFMQGDILQEQIVFNEGKVAVPDRPGFGFDLDLNKLDQFGRNFEREMVFYDAEDPDFQPRTGIIL
ncbi:mandelate racemase/muconate lactonizing enzyme family protein [Paenibacillus sp. J5C_2022]|uniref:mandelate racemase/muconate lactonizing enzyme family protein n=1 Tax=Paenibacillus sp. J5C2022 TaxID=2977129 RepID=UPI0021D33500|nr:mandelate racemase/muconate lactonizing enzyme family protein [Paenibacillus sp. J5C2022]MCU6712040.1 mandelate racemase/muconate lactonizing enzyme family protein [Paenibacillus sp. J5C2022]